MIKRKKLIFLAICFSFILVVYIFFSALTYNQISFNENSIKINGKILYQKHTPNSMFTISYEQETKKFYVRFLKKEMCGIGSFKTNLIYNSNLFSLNSILNKNYRYQYILKKNKLTEVNKTPSSGALGCIGWYTKKSILGTMISDTEITLILKENQNFNLKNINSIIFIQ